MRIKLEDVCKRIYAGGDVPKEKYSLEKTEKYNIPIYANAEKDSGLYGYTDEAREFDIAITVAARGTIGFTAIRTEPFFPVVRLITVVPELKKITPEYLYYALKNCRPKSSGTSIPQLTVPEIKVYSFNICTLEEQERISNILKRIEKLIGKSEQQLQLLDTLIKARFVEMTENSTTVRVRMGDVATYTNGYAFKPIDWTTEGLPIIRIQNLNDKTAPYNHYSGTIDSKYRVCYGDILVSWATHLEAYVWQGGDAWLNQHIFRVIFDKMPINKIYFVYSTEEALRQAFRNAHGFKPTMEHIKRSDFEDAVIELPPIEVQDQFAAFVSQIDKSKIAVQKALDEAQLLFDSLMQEYFG